MHICVKKSRFLKVNRKSRQAMLCCLSMQPTMVTIAGYFCELAMPYKMCILLVFILTEQVIKRSRVGTGLTLPVNSACRYSYLGH